MSSTKKGGRPTKPKFRLFVLSSCKECPNKVEERTMGAGYAIDWNCKAAERMIKGYIEWPSEEPKKIPDWCPLPAKRR